MRLFVAVNPPAQLHRDLATRLDGIRRRVPIAWTRPEAWHLTLMFLDDWPAERVPALAGALREAVAGLAPFAIRPGAVGAFPDLRRPRVLYLHLDGGEPLQRLADAIRGAVDRVWPDGPQDRRDFRPHLTLARVKQPPAPAALDLLRRLDLGVWEPFAVAAAVLLASELRPQGARYTEQAHLVLGG
jgi:RNA 2',3'-cyclic 3'-phosphodiesterase